MSSIDQSEYSVLDQLLSNNYRFAIYRLPHSQEVNFILQTDNESTTYNDFYTLGKNKGFVIAPFLTSKNHPIVLIRPDIHLVGKDAIIQYLNSLNLSKGIHHHAKETKIQSEISTFEAYKPVFELFHKNIVSKRFEKLVLSRTCEVDKPTSNSLGAIFERACTKYPHNFVYLCNSPQSGAWLGCSPEVIIAGNNNEWKTDALAGTQKVSTDTNAMLWDVKNAKEQAIVSDYIQKQLLGLGVESVKGEAKTVRSGDLIHIRTEFTFRLEDTTQLGKVIAALHPTPAVSGYPKDEAFRFIAENEHYDRAYYAGFVGLLDIDNQTDLYVNLRCMQITEHKLKLYAGGGIMPQSTAEAEWQETEYKLQTILSIL